MSIHNWIFYSCYLVKKSHYLKRNHSFLFDFKKLASSVLLEGAINLLN